MDRYQQVFENNKKWIIEKTADNKEYFKNMETGQQPDFLFIGCSDSRVPANEIMGLAPGEVFVHRNVANIVSNIDINVQSVIEYAVEHLHVKYIVVCGHYHCGGIKAAMHPDDLGLLNGWLRNISDVYRMHFDELTSIADLPLRQKRLVELNVIEQCLNVAKSAAVQKAYFKGELKGVYGWVYDVGTGELIDLKIDIRSIADKFREIYILNKD
ncbi:MAG TPA: carbonic anhydrase [Parafilimonas sp.]|nr:carbonic anhydrase [Parafilimonas sp.]